MTGGWLSVLVASALGSLHCVGMCGPLVAFYATGERAGGAVGWAPHLAYHSARLVAYTLLGAAAGQLGSALDALGVRLGFAPLGVLLVALTLTFWGLPLLIGRRVRPRLLQLRRARPQRGWPRRLEAALATLVQRLRARPPAWRAGVLGLSSALLPCGWLYAFVALAAGTGSAARGAGLLLAFWAGSAPALFGLGVGLERLSARLRARSARLSAALVLGVCAVTVAGLWPAALANDAAGALPTPSCHAPR